MILKSIHIYGFGKYQDFTLQLTPGMNIIEGRNEAGKSTLLSFVKAILFGFENRRTPELRLEPLEGGRFGGSLTLLDVHGQEYRIERTNQKRSQGWVRVMMPDGTERGEEMIPLLLDGMTSSFYMNIFAFGLNELSYLTSLNQEEVANYLYHSGTGVTQQQLKKTWTDEMDRLFKPRGNQPYINKILHSLEELNQQIVDIQKGNESYNRILLQKEELDRKVIEVEELLVHIRKEQKRWEKLKEIYPIYEELKTWQDRICHLPDIPEFPENGLARLEELERQIREVSVDLEGNLRKIKSLKEELASLPGHSSCLEWEDEINTLYLQANRWIEKKEQYASLQLELDQYRREFQNALNQLGMKWTEEKLLQLDVSFSKKELFREKRQLFHHLSISFQTLNEMIQNKEEENEELSLQIEQMEKKIRTQEPVEYLTQWEDHWINFQQLSHSLEAEQRQKDWIDQQCREEKSRRLKSSSTKQRNPWAMVSALSFLIGVTGSLMLFLNNESISSFIAIPGLLGTLLAILFWKIGASLLSKEQRGAMSSHLNHLEQKLQELEQSMADKKNVLSNLSIHVFHGEREKQRIKEWMQELRQKRKTFLQLADQLNWLRERQAQLVNEIKKLHRKKEMSESHFQEERDRWNEILQSLHLPIGLSPDGAHDILLLAEKTKEWLGKANLLKEKLEMHDSEWEEFTEQVHYLCQKTQLPLENSDPWHCLKVIQQRLKEEKQSQSKKGELSSQLKEQEEQKLKRESMLKRIEDEQVRLFTAAGVTDGEMFRKASKQYIERRQAEEKIGMLRDTIQAASGGLDLENQVIPYSLEEIEDQRQRWLQEYSEQNLCLQEILDQRGQCKNNLRRLESGEQLTVLLQQREELLAEAEEAGRKWILYRLAQQVLEKTLESFEAKKQPGVIQDASSYFSTMTDGKYPRILSPIGEQKLIVERQDGLRFDPGFLSRGTKEQLFLSLRFALIKASSRVESLPVLLDDIFVNFDERRTMTGIHSLKSLLKDHQVIFFTCHSHLVEWIREAIPHVNWVNLEQANIFPMK